MRPLLVALLLALPLPALAQDATPPLPRERPTAAQLAAQEAKSTPKDAEAEAPAPAEKTETVEAVQDSAPSAESAKADEATGEPGVPLPRSRPDEKAATVDQTPEGTPEGVAAAKEAPPEPPRIYQVACPAIIGGLVTAKVMEPIDEKMCHVQSPYQVTALSVGGRQVELSSPATLNCEMATALGRWVDRVSAYTEAMFNQPVSGISIGTSYYCRPRNNVEGADVSEHGFANAADVTGFTLKDGTRISLPADWPKPGEYQDHPGGKPDYAARTMSHAHDAACGFFTTVLGPEANALHRDHIHVDLGCHGHACTMKMCE